MKGILKNNLQIKYNFPEKMSNFEGKMAILRGKSLKKETLF